jgi:hypothetical protein
MSETWLFMSQQFSRRLSAFMATSPPSSPFLILAIRFAKTKRKQNGDGSDYGYE